MESTLPGWPLRPVRHTAIPSTTRRTGSTAWLSQTTVWQNNPSAIIKFHSTNAYLHFVMQERTPGRPRRAASSQCRIPFQLPLNSIVTNTDPVSSWRLCYRAVSTWSGLNESLISLSSLMTCHPGLPNWAGLLQGIITEAEILVRFLIFLNPQYFSNFWNNSSDYSWIFICSVTRFRLYQSIGSADSNFTEYTTPINADGSVNLTVQVPYLSEGEYVKYRVAGKDSSNNMADPSNVVSMTGPPFRTGGISNSTMWALIGVAIAILLIILIIVLTRWCCPVEAKRRQRQAKRKMRQWFSCGDKTAKRADTAPTTRYQSPPPTIEQWNSPTISQDGELPAVRSDSNASTTPQPQVELRQKTADPVRTSTYGSERIYFGQEDIDRIKSGPRSETYSERCLIFLIALDVVHIFCFTINITGARMRSSNGRLPWTFSWPLFCEWIAAISRLTVWEAMKTILIQGEKKWKLLLLL